MKELFLNFLNMIIMAGWIVLALAIGGIEMEELFLNFLNMSITAGWIVLVLVLVRPLLKKAPKWITCALWGLVALRLVLPFSVESAISLIPSTETVPPEAIYQTEPQIHSGITILNSAVNPILSEHFSASGFETETMPGPKVYPFEGLVRVLAFLWLAGAAAMLLYMFFSFLALRIRLREAVKDEEDCYLSDKVESPFIFGIVNPRIYLPTALSDEDKGHVLAHERAHLKRKDHLIKPFAFFLLSFYWFNPLLWLAYLLLCKDIETACDEKVIRHLDAEGKKGYSSALLHCSIDKKGRRALSACPLAFGETGVKGRIKSVLSYKKPALWVLIGALLLSLILSGCLLTDPKNDALSIGAEEQIALSKIILEENHNDKRGNTKAFEGHTVFGTEEKNGDYIFYLWINYEEYTLENGRLECYMGLSAPAKIVMELKDEEGFVLKEYTVPRDGSNYDDDIRKMVPMKWWKHALNGQKYAEKNTTAMWDQIDRWLMKEGVYNYAFEDYDRSYLSLKENGTFSLIPSTRGAYFPYGRYTYSEETGLIVCISDDLGEKYVFKKDTNTLIFVAKESASLPEYSYNGKVRPCIPDGAIFTEPGFIPESDFIFPQVDGIAFDIDGDGERERFSLTHGPTSGVNSYYLTMLKGEEQTRVLLSPCGLIYGFDIINGDLYLRGIYGAHDEESYLYEVFLDHEKLTVKSIDQGNLLCAPVITWDYEASASLTLPEHKDLTFSFKSDFYKTELTMTSKGKKPQVIQPPGYAYGKRNAFFVDITQDGYRDFCLPFAMGSGWVTNGIFVYDIKNNHPYILHERSVTDFVQRDYYVCSRNDSFIVIKSEKNSTASGILYIDPVDQALRFMEMQIIDESAISCNINGQKLKAKLSGFTFLNTDIETIAIYLYQEDVSILSAPLYSGTWKHTTILDDLHVFRYSSFSLVTNSKGEPFIKAVSVSGTSAEYYPLSIQDDTVVAAKDPVQHIF